MFKSIKSKFYKYWFRLTKGEYMRTAYLKPRSVALITMRAEGKDNVLPVDWHMPLSFTPKLYCISLEKGNHSSQMIQASKEFAVNFMPAEKEELVISCGKISGKTGDKLKLLNIETNEAALVNVPLINCSLGYLECRVVDIVETGDHLLFIAQVLFESELTEGKELHHITNI